MKERLNSGESKRIFRNISCIVLSGLTTSGRKVWQEEEETRKDTSIVLIRQEQSCTSELFKVIQDAVSLILLLDKTHKDPDTFDLGAPFLALYMHKTWKKFQNTVYWVDIKIALKKELKFYQTRSNAIILYETLPAFCVPKVVRMEIGEVIYEKVFASFRLPPTISLKHDWMKELGSEIDQRPVGQVVQQIHKFLIKPTKSKPRS